MTQYKLVPVEPKQEMDAKPVAWMHPESNRWVEADYDYSDGYGRSARTAQKYGWRPLYAAPQPAKREPLTDEQIAAVAKVEGST